MNRQQKQALFDNVLTLLEQHSLLPNSTYASDTLKQELLDTINRAVDTSKDCDTREVTILLADLRGFTELFSDYPSDKIIDLLNRYFSMMSEIVFAHGGSIDRFVGDSLLVVFGANKASKDDIARCISCAVEMQIAMAKINVQNHSNGLPDLYLGIGINTGEVVAGNLGSKRHNEYALIGEQINITSRIEAHSLRGQILLSESSYEKAQSFIEVGPANEVRCATKEKVKLYELQAIIQPKILKVPKREIRKSPRVPVNMPIHFHCVEGKKISTDTQQGIVFDIGYGGFSITTKEPLTPYSQIKINLALSLMGQAYSEVFAKVVRCLPTENAYESHLAFEGLDQEAELVLKQFVDQHVERL